MTLELPPALRAALKQPLGTIASDLTAIDSLTDPERPVIAVGDVVTSDLLAERRRPAVAVVDGRTERSSVSETVESRITDAEFETELSAKNPPGTLTVELAEAVREGVAGGPTLIRVDGEEDLAALPTILAAPDDAVVLYGQPGEGVVAVTVEEAARDRVRELLEQMTGDLDSFLEALSP